MKKLAPAEAAAGAGRQQDARDAASAQAVAHRQYERVTR
jgi:hypothetical protein